MDRTLGRSRWMFAAMALLTGLLLVLAGCGDDDDDDDTGADPTAQTTEANGDNGDAPTDADQPDNGANGGDVAGTITIGDESWDLIPTIQCGNFYDVAGQIYISGVAAEDEAIEITIDYDESLSDAKVENSTSGEQPFWISDDITFDVDGDVISGSGTFGNFLTQEEAEGSFEVTC